VTSSEEERTFQSESLGLSAVLLDVQRPLGSLDGRHRFSLFCFNVTELLLQAFELRVCLCNFSTKLIQCGSARLRQLFVLPLAMKVETIPLLCESCLQLVQVLLVAVFNVGDDALLLFKLHDDLGMLFSQSG
jgi:hypothetical protein